MPVILALWEAKVGGSQVQEIRDLLGQHSETLSLLKIQKLAGYGGASVVPATREAEAGESLEPRKWRLKWVEITPLHSSLGDRVRLHLKKQQQ